MALTNIFISYLCWEGKKDSYYEICHLVKKIKDTDQNFVTKWFDKFLEQKKTMSTTAASEFHVMDLDAVLDEFESSQTLEAAVVATPPKTP